MNKNFPSIKDHNQELETIRARFDAAQISVSAFTIWLEQHLRDDFRWLLAAIDGYELALEVAAEQAADQTDES